MKNKKIFALSIIFIIIIIFIFVFILIKDNSLSNNYGTVSNISDIEEAYDVKACVDKFYIYCKEYLSAEPNLVYDLLDKDYIKKFRITKYNIKEHLDLFSSDDIQIMNVLKINQNNNISAYYITANQIYKDIENTTKEMKFILKIDKENYSFSVYLEDFINDKEYNNLKIGDKLKFGLKSVIPDNDFNNKFDSNSKTMPDNAEDIFDDFITRCLYYPNVAYDFLDESCKQYKYANYEEFEQYIKDNTRDFVNMELYSYEDIKNGDSLEYKCKSTTGQVYTFKIKSYIIYTVTIE